MSAQLQFLGAAGTVTGSRYLLDHDGGRVLIDCGLFQGLKQLRLRNRAAFPAEPASISDIILTHAHIDHTGYLPVLVRDGFEGPVHATAATCDLAQILLPDSAHLQEEEAERANRYGYSRHHPALPLYTTADAERALRRLRTVDWDEPRKLAGFEFAYSRAGHILGAASVAIAAGARRIVFSGDIGRPGDPLLLPPAPRPESDYLIIESTYGDRVHDPEPAAVQLERVLQRTFDRGGVVVIPAFAVGRTQILLYHLRQLRTSHAIPDVPIFLDSPMAADTTRLMQQHASEHRLAPAECEAVGRTATITKSVAESKAIDARSGPMIVISASGMATGGRVLFHLKRFAGDRRNTILLAGHQAAGTRGDALLRGARTLRIHGADIAVNAEVVALHGLSAHADANELMDWMRSSGSRPRRTYITHGEPVAADALRRRIQDELGWDVHVPEHLEMVPLD